SASNGNLAELLDSRITNIGDTAGTFLARLETASEDLARSFQDRTSGLSESLMTSGEAVASLLESRIAAIDERSESFLDRVDSSTGAVTAADRKSTRLNSSHVKISYAVFCLKKKIKKKTRYLCIQK